MRQNIAKVNTVKSVMESKTGIQIKERLNEILGKKASGFISSMINISNNPSLKNCNPMSIISSAVVAATLDLPIDPNLGFAYIVPYNDKKKGKIAQFQMGYKGFIQLAMRSGQYKTINAAVLYNGDIKKVNKLTGEIEINDDNKNVEKVAGYVAYFRLINGFEKALFMTKEQVEKHAKMYSQSYKSNKKWVRDNSLWTTNFDTMAIKTVIKRLLSKYGILSIEMQTGIKADQAVIKEGIIKKNSNLDENIDYADNPKDIKDVDYEEVKEEIKNEANKESIDIDNTVSVKEKKDNKKEVVEAEIIESKNDDNEEAPY